MRYARTYLSLAIALFLSGCSSNSSEVVAGESGVRRFHEMLDTHRFEQIYRESAQEMKIATSEQDFIQFLDAISRKLGASSVASKKAWTVTYGTTGRFVSLTYSTSFAQGEATEKFVFKVSGAEASLAGYNINSMALVVK